MDLPYLFYEDATSITTYLTFGLYIKQATQYLTFHRLCFIKTKTTRTTTLFLLKQNTHSPDISINIHFHTQIDK